MSCWKLHHMMPAASPVSLLKSVWWTLRFSGIPGGPKPLLFLHATRLDLDDYNNEADQGLHITSMPGSWLAIVRGFAGMQVLKETLCFSPVIPQKWDSYSFKVNYLKNTLHIRVGKEIEISLTAGSKVDIQVYGHPYTLERGTELKINMPMCQ